MVQLDLVIALLHQYGYVFLFLIATVEGPIIAILGGFFASQGFFNIYFVYLIAILGDLAGDSLYYGIGRFGRIPRVERIGNRLGISAHHLSTVEKYFERHAVKTLWYAKYTQTGIVALPAAGAARMPFLQFLWYNMLATLPKSAVLVLIGYFFGYAYSQIDSYISKVSIVLFLLAIAGILFIRARNRTKKTYE